MRITIISNMIPIIIMTSIIMIIVANLKLTFNVIWHKINLSSYFIYFTHFIFIYFLNFIFYFLLIFIHFIFVYSTTFFMKSYKMYFTLYWIFALLNTNFLVKYDFVYNLYLSKNLKKNDIYRQLKLLIMIDENYDNF